MWNIINRTGYGSNFNIIMVNNKKTLLKKKTYNEYGKSKLTKEVNFYNFIKDNKIAINIPEIYEYDNDKIVMMYLNSEKYDYNVNNILNELYILHNSKSLAISKEDYYNNIYQELITKTINRYYELKNIIINYNLVNNINNVNIIIRFDEIMDNIEKFINIILDDKTEYIFYPIHGDPQYNNIIYSKNKYYFIDPRGYFGNILIYGLKEYDIAKIYFSLSGYDLFDDIKININTIMDGDRLNIPFIKIPQGLEKEDSLVIICFIIIWLSNGHIFINDPNKAFISHCIGLYYANYYCDILEKSLNK